jgi:guanylate kinase
MNRIFCILGKSASGKDTLYRRLMDMQDLGLRSVVTYTTRPIRSGEQEGREYHFSSVPEFREAERKGLVIESRCYQTVMGPWYYYTMNDGQIDLEAGSYLLIGTLESLLSLQAVFGKERVVPIYVELDDGERLLRALNRERAMKTPRYDELCRRYLGDEKDFSPEKIEEAGIRDRFDNTDLEACLGRIRDYILKLSLD